MTPRPQFPPGRWAKGLPHLVALLAAACAAPADAPESELPQVDVRHALPAGTILLLRPVELAPEGDFDSILCDALLQAALRQSVAFDVADPRDGLDTPGEVDGRQILEIAVQADPVAGVLTTTLRPSAAAPIPLGSAVLANRTLAAAIDELAWTTRGALGEHGAPAPVPIAEGYSANSRCVRQTEDAIDRISRGDLGAALKTLEEARRRDGGSPAVLAALAAAQSLVGNAKAAEQLALEALGYQQRLTPTTTHGLGRTLLLARASLRPQNAETFDRELLQLAETGQRERPFDPQPQLTRCLALNFLGRFDESAAELRQLEQRLPRNATVHYHLGWAELALQRPSASLAAFDRAWRSLPRQATAIPRAIAMFEAEEHDELAELLESLARSPGVRGGSALHEVLRMQAAHAILESRVDDAVRFLRDDLEWLRARPSMLEERTLDLAEDGEVMVRLGHAEDLDMHLRAIGELRLSTPTLADAIAFLSGMVEITRTGRRAETAEASLSESGGHDAWSSILRAMGHRQRGELMDEAAALSQAARLSDDALVKASLIRALRAMGRQEEAAQLRDALRREMLTVRLRRRSPHPLLSPGRALAFITP